MSSILQSVACFYHLSPSSLDENAHTYPSQQTNQDTGDEFDEFIGGLCDYNLSKIPASQARERHCKENTEYFKSNLAHQLATREIASLVQLPLLLDNRQNDYAET